MFTFDASKYRFIDLSLQIVPNQTDPYRPFEAVEGRLGDGTRKFDITRTHTHVGTHIESPWHFYGGETKTCTDYPLGKFQGPAYLLHGVLEQGQVRVSLEAVKKQLEGMLGEFRILVVRNETDQKPLRFEMECVHFFAELQLDLLVFESNIEFGQGLEDGRTFHDLMLSKDTLLVEFPANLCDLDRDLFYVMAMPLNIRKLDSSPCRLLAVLDI